MRFIDLHPAAQVVVLAMVVLLVARLLALLGEQLDRPAATPTHVNEAADVSPPVRRPSWFATEHEHMLYDLEINRTAAELFRSKTDHTQAKVAFVRAFAELDDVLAARQDEPPRNQDEPARSNSALSAGEIAELLDLLPDTDPAFRARFIRLVAARLEEARR